MKYRKYNEAMRDSDRRFEDLMRDSNHRFDEERDKRYASENELRAMALRIKETADAKALDLASQIQTYKDDKADKTREQSLTERGAYATRGDLTQAFAKSEENLISAIGEVKSILKPMIDHVAADSGSQLTIGRMIAYIIATGVIVGIVFTILSFIFKT